MEIYSGPQHIMSALRLKSSVSWLIDFPNFLKTVRTVMNNWRSHLGLFQMFAEDPIIGWNGERFVPSVTGRTLKWSI